MARYGVTHLRPYVACGQPKINAEEPPTAVPVEVGQRMNVDGDLRRCAVRAVTDNAAVPTRQVKFYREGILAYSMIDQRCGLRRAVCPGTDTDEQCQKLAESAVYQGNSQRGPYATIPGVIAPGRGSETLLGGHDGVAR